MIKNESGSEADGIQESEHTTWYVKIFPIRETHRTLLGKRKRVTAGYGWSAHGTPEGHRYDAGPYKSFDLAGEAARKALANLGPITGDIDDGGTPSTSRPVAN
jgi:hypothetical protein